MEISRRQNHANRNIQGVYDGPYTIDDRWEDEGEIHLDGIEDNNEVKSSNGDRPSALINFVKRYLLIILLTISIIVGLIMGIGLRNHNLTDRQIMYIAFPGDLLIRMLKIVVIPLVTSSLIAGIANLPSKSTGRLGLVTATYFLLTSVVAVVVGLLLVNAIGPGYKGKSHEPPSSSLKHKDGTTVSDSILDLIRNMFPDNLIEASFRITVSRMVVDSNEDKQKPLYGANNTQELTKVKSNVYGQRPDVEKVDGMNILGLLVFCGIFGILLGKLGETGKVVLQFFQVIMILMVKFVTLVIWYSPIGIVFVLASRIVIMRSPIDEFYRLAYYVGTVIGGLAVQAFILQPIIYLIIIRRNPLFHAFHCLQALLTALATASSAATLPVLMHCLEEVAKVNKYVVRFVAPVGGTINMDGTAVNLVVAVVFIGQATGQDINAATIIITGITGILASVATAGVPEGSIFSMIMMLQAARFDVDGWYLIYAVDWFLDRCRTTTNIWGDCVCARIVEKFCKDQLEEKVEEPREIQSARVTFI